MSLRPDRLFPLLAHIQTHLARDLSLAALSKKAGLSTSRFHEIFSQQVGETPRHYVERLRIERAAFRLLIQDASILQIALDAGYNNPETFSRAFRRRKRVAPRDYRGWALTQRGRRADAESESVATASGRFVLSATKIVHLRPQHLAYIRHVGPYADVPESLFDELRAWAQRKHMRGPLVWMGIGHDAPVTTAPEHQRFDAALLVPAPFRPDGIVGYQLFPGGTHAVTTHVGGYESLPQAYARVFPRLFKLRGYRVTGLPAIELYASESIDLSASLNQTDICIPIAHR